jgi:hypothetical protein
LEPRRDCVGGGEELEVAWAANDFAVGSEAEGLAGGFVRAEGAFTQASVDGEGSCGERDYERD